MEKEKFPPCNYFFFMCWSKSLLISFCYLVIFCFVSVHAISGPKAITYMGVDDNVDPAVVSQLQGILRNIPQVEYIGTLSMGNFTDIQMALNSGMQALVLCPGDSPFLTSTQIETLISDFVTGGGLLMYTANSGDVRAQQVSTWFSDISGLLNIQSTKSPLNINYLSEYNLYGFPAYVAYPTNESLTTSFGRIDSEYLWGNPFHWFPDPLYWIYNDTYHMQLTPQNEEYCMFRRNGYYYNSVDENACWLFNFPYQQGKIVELGFSLTELNFSEYLSNIPEFRVYGAISASIGQLIEELLFETKSRNIMVRREYNPFSSEYTNAFKNILYDLSLISNVYINRYPPDFATIQYLTNADAYVITPWGASEYYNIKKRESGNFFYDLRDFV